MQPGNEPPRTVEHRLDPGEGRKDDEGGQRLEEDDQPEEEQREQRRRGEDVPLQEVHIGRQMGEQKAEEDVAEELGATTHYQVADSVVLVQLSTEKGRGSSSIMKHGFCAKI